MTMVGLPLILFQVEGEEDDMGDLEYLARIANGELSTGVLKTFIGVAAGSQTIATVPTGKDWYLMAWSVIQDNLASVSELEFPTGTAIDSNKTGTTTEAVYNGIAKGNKIVADDTVTITTSTTVAKQINLFVLEVDTGVSPKL